MLAPLALAACDPAQPYGAALAWPETQGRPSRAAGAFVIMRSGVPLVYLERGGRSLTPVEGATGDDSWVEALVALVNTGQVGAIEVRKVDGQPIAEHQEVADALIRGGFRPGYRGPILRP